MFRITHRKENFMSDFLKQFKEEHINIFLKHLLKTHGDWMKAGECTIYESTGEENFQISARLATELQIDKQFKERYEHAKKYLSSEDRKAYADMELRKIISSERDSGKKIEAIKTFIKLHSLENADNSVGNTMKDFFKSLK